MTIFLAIPVLFSGKVMKKSPSCEGDLQMFHGKHLPSQGVHFFYVKGMGVSMECPKRADYIR